MRTTLFLILLIVCNSAYSCKLTVRLEQFSSQSVKLADNQWQGLDADLIKALLDEINCSFEVKDLPWEKAIKMLRTGELDMMLNVSKNPTREEYFHFIGPVNEEVVVVATTQDKPISLTSIEDILLLDKPVAIQRGVYYGREVSFLLKQGKYQSNFVQVTKNKSKIELLKSGKVSGFLESRKNLLYSIETDPEFKNVSYDPLIIYHNYVYYAFSKKTVSNKLKEKLHLAHQRLVANKAFIVIHQKNQ